MPCISAGNSTSLAPAGISIEYMAMSLSTNLKTILLNCPNKYNVLLHKPIDGHFIGVYEGDVPIGASFKSLLVFTCNCK